MVSESLKNRLSRGRFLIPNMVTVGNMFCGFLTVIYATSGRFDKAVLAIALAILLDGLDGRVARRLNATSKFGVEFDSFSDLVSFGIAPAILMYNWCFKVLADEFGVIVTFVYLLAAAGRLARFNITTTSLTNFQGLPSPAAAAMVAAIVNVSPFVESSDSLVIMGGIVMPLIGFLMVSNFEFLSIKRFRLEEMNAPTRIFLGISIALVWYKGWVGFLVLGAVYCLSGPYMAIRRKIGLNKKNTPTS